MSRNVLDSSVPTTVIIFRDDASFPPYNPLSQGRPANVAGFFLPGDEVNYIALSLDPNDKDPYSTAIHEYVHLHLKDNVPDAPLWLNEGLAELYGSLQFSGNDALLGAPLFQYIRLLREHRHRKNVGDVLKIALVRQPEAIDWVETEVAVPPPAATDNDAVVTH